MNRALYTILIIAASVGITLALSAACSKDCVCNENTGAQNDAAYPADGSDSSAYANTDTDADDNSGSQTSGSNSSGNNSSGASNGNGTGNSQDQPAKKYGDAETGGNVYTEGGYTPGSGPGKPGMTTSPGGTVKAKTKGGSSGTLKTGSDGQRTN